MQGTLRRPAYPCHPLLHLPNHYLIPGALSNFWVDDPLRPNDPSGVSSLVRSFCSSRFLSAVFFQYYSRDRRRGGTGAHWFTPFLCCFSPALKPPHSFHLRSSLSPSSTNFFPPPLGVFPNGLLILTIPIDRESRPFLRPK